MKTYRVEAGGWWVDVEAASMPTAASRGLAIILRDLRKEGKRGIKQVTMTIKELSVELRPPEEETELAAAPG